MKNILIFSLLILFTGCIELADTENVKDYATETYPMDTVRLISSDGQNQKQQGSYTVSADKHLLMRFDDFNDHAGKVRAKPDDASSILRVKVLVYPKGDLAVAADILRLCVVTRQWLIQATWERAHPYSNAGVWSRLGGDYSDDACITGKLDAPPNVTPPTRLAFDITDWFFTYMKASPPQNTGFILVGLHDSAVVNGDRAGELSPRMYWLERTY